MFFFKFFKKYIHLFILFCSVKQSFFIKNINIKYLKNILKRFFIVIYYKKSVTILFLSLYFKYFKYYFIINYVHMILLNILIKKYP